MWLIIVEGVQGIANDDHVRNFSLLGTKTKVTILWREVKGNIQLLADVRGSRTYPIRVYVCVCVGGGGISVGAHDFSLPVALLVPTPPLVVAFAIVKYHTNVMHFPCIFASSHCLKSAVSLPFPTFIFSQIPSPVPPFHSQHQAKLPTPSRETDFSLFYYRGWVVNGIWSVIWWDSW